MTVIVIPLGQASMGVALIVAHRENMLHAAMTGFLICMLSNCQNWKADEQKTLDGLLEILITPILSRRQV